MSEQTFSLLSLLGGLVPDAVNDDRLQGIEVTGLSQDSRQVQPGDLFFARNGVNHKGMDFVSSAAAEGAVAAIVDDAELAAADPIETAIPLIGVASVAALIGEVASRFYGEPSKVMQLIGITGTNGKTSCSHYIAQMIESVGGRCGLIGTVGNGLLGRLNEATHTTPDAISLHALLADLYRQGATAVVMEVSSHALDQYRVAGVDFDAAGFTNLSRDHLDYHGDMASYGAAKARLFRDLNIPLQAINRDDDFGAALSKEENISHCVTFGESAEAQVRAANVRLSNSGISADISTPWGTFVLQTGLIGRFNLSNLLLAISLVGQMGLDIEQIAAAVNAVTAVPGRMQRVNQQLPLVVVDYAHTPDALEKALLSLRTHCEGKLWCVFGCGGDRDNGKRALMGGVADQHADEIVVTSDNPRTEDPQRIIDMIVDGIKRPAPVINSDRKQAIGYAVSGLRPGDILLIAGKGHENYQDIQGVKMPFDDLAVAREALSGRPEQ